MLNQNYFAKGNLFKRLLILPFLYLAWFSPHKSLRVLFHRIRGVHIGKNVEIGYFCIIGNVHPKMIKINDNAVITARVSILEHDNSYYYTVRGNVRFGNVVIGKGSFIGIGSVILPNVTIGDGAIVGANSVVTKDIRPKTLNGGVPCKELRIL